MEGIVVLKYNFGSSVENRLEKNMIGSNEITSEAVVGVQ